MAFLEMNHISKAFGGEQALSDVSLHIEKGEVHALLGENGAGKSTLMRILTGVLQADSGAILFDGIRYTSPTIQEMEAAGIAFVHQELNVINDLSVADNIFLCREKKNWLGFIRIKEQIALTRKLFSDLGVNIDPEAMVSTLKPGEKQLLEICRALYMDAKLLILDEPTTSLSSDEIERLFEIINNLKKQGKSFIFISHKMPEIFTIADRYTIFRNGELISTGHICNTTVHKLTLEMVGKTEIIENEYVPRTLGEPFLELSHLSGKGIEDVSLTVRKGEIIAFTGLNGCGTNELFLTLYGVLPIRGGSFMLDGQKITSKNAEFTKKVSGLLPADRMDNSVLPDLNILENFGISRHVLRPGEFFLRKKADLLRFNEQKQAINIKASDTEEGILTLSGGNMQKVFLARLLNAGAGLLILDNPTQGVDVGAKEDIYKTITALAQRGKTILLNTMEIPEVIKVADRCAVFCEGRLAKVLNHDEVTEQTVMLYATHAVEQERENDHP